MDEILARPIKETTEGSKQQENNQQSASQTAPSVIDIKELKKVSLTKYSFYEADMQVKVSIPLEHIHTIPKDQIKIEFQQRSFMIDIDNLNDKNYHFGVPKLQCKIVPEKSKIRVQKDKISVTLQKVSENDNWFALFKTKTIGGDSD